MLVRGCDVGVKRVCEGGGVIMVVKWFMIMVMKGSDKGQAW